MLYKTTWQYPISGLDGVGGEGGTGDEEANNVCSQLVSRFIKSNHNGQSEQRLIYQGAN